MKKNSVILFLSIFFLLLLSIFNLFSQENTKKDFIVDKKSIKLIVGTWQEKSGGQVQFSDVFHSKVAGFKCYKYYSSGSAARGGVYTILKKKKGGPIYIFESRDEKHLLYHTPVVLEFKGKNTLVMSQKNENTNFEVVLNRIKVKIRTRRKKKKLSKDELNRVLQKLWEMMRKSLINRDIDAAVSCFVKEKQEDYKQMFTTLKTELPKIGRNMKPIEPVSIEEDGAKYRLIRKEEIKGKTYDITYYIYFVVDVDGEWRILRY